MNPIVRSFFILHLGIPSTTFAGEMLAIDTDVGLYRSETNTEPGDCTTYNSNHRLVAKVELLETENGKSKGSIERHVVSLNGGRIIEAKLQVYIERARDGSVEATFRVRHQPDNFLIVSQHFTFRNQAEMHRAQPLVFAYIPGSPLPCPNAVSLQYVGLRS